MTSFKLPNCSRYELYKKSIGNKIEKDFTSEDIKKILKMTKDDFLNGLISTDDISSVCNNILTKALESKGSILDIVLAGAELGYYIRQNDNLSNFTKRLEKFLNL